MKGEFVWRRDIFIRLTRFGSVRLRAERGLGVIGVGATAKVDTGTSTP